MTVESRRLTLQTSRVRWLSETPDDLCPHGSIDLKFGSTVLCSEADGVELTLSSASLRLLRTLKHDHPPGGDGLFPCCGFTFLADDDGGFVILGCPNGVQITVTRNSGMVALKRSGRATVRVDEAEWRSAVHAFADQVSAFYMANPPRTPADEDDEGWRRFAAEWGRLRGVPLDPRIPPAKGGDGA